MRKLYLSNSNRRIFGLCGGIGETYDIDPTLVRLTVVFLALASGILPALITYFIAWIIIPNRPGM